MKNTEINIEQKIDNFVADKKRIQINPFIATRIINSIENKRNKHAALLFSLQYILVSVAFILVVFTGIQLGGLYHSYTNNNYSALSDGNINYLSAYMNVDKNFFSE